MFTSINPATGEPGQSFAELTEAQVEARVAKAHTAFLDWRTSDPHDRMTLLRHIAEAFEDDKDRLARIATEEMGKTLKSAVAEVEKCASAFRYYAKHGAQFLKPAEVETPVGHATAHWLPMGVVLAVMPWNFPYYQVARFAAPNLMLGNTILLKHAPNCPQSALLMEEIFVAAGLPADAYVNVFASNEQVADMIADPRVHTL